jgi:hypothetical protein
MLNDFRELRKLLTNSNNEVLAQLMILEIRLGQIEEQYGNLEKIPPIELNNISREDFVLWDTKKNCPKEDLDIVYHFTSVIDFLNDGMKIEEGEEFWCIKNIPLRWQVLYDAELERCK